MKFPIIKKDILLWGGRILILLVICTLCFNFVTYIMYFFYRRKRDISFRFFTDLLIMIAGYIILKKRNFSFVDFRNSLMRACYLIWQSFSEAFQRKNNI